MREAADALRPGGGHRGDGPAPRRDDDALRRLPPGRRAQHAELRPAEGAGHACASRCCSSAGLSATIEEWLLSAEYILAGGNSQVILCERGIRTFENATRNTLDISAIPVVKKRSHLPIVVDPSHGTGRRDKVIPMARAAVAAGADGLLIEVHNDPEKALSDGAAEPLPGAVRPPDGRAARDRSGAGPDAAAGAWINAAANPAQGVAGRRSSTRKTAPSGRACISAASAEARGGAVSRSGGRCRRPSGSGCLRRAGS